MSVLKRASTPQTQFFAAAKMYVQMRYSISIFGYWKWHELTNNYISLMQKHYKSDSLQMRT